MLRYPGARALQWVNPDSAYQLDTLLVRGADLYRVDDVPPVTGTATAGRAHEALEHARAAVVSDVLACGLPRAGCDTAAVTTSILMRAKYQTVRYIKTVHNLDMKTVRLRSDASDHAL